MTTEETNNEQTITDDGLQKSLEDLDALLQDNALDKSQIIQGKQSSKGAMKEDPVEEDADRIPDGTDYAPAKGTKKSLESESISKANGEEDDEGLETDEGEDDAKGVKKGIPPMIKADEEDEKEEKAIPSSGNESLVQQGGTYTPAGKPDLMKKSEDDLDVSSFLFHFTHALDKALIGMEMRLTEDIRKSINDDSDLTKAISKTVSDMDTQIKGRLERVDDIEKSAARAPKSVLNTGEQQNRSNSPSPNLQSRRLEISAALAKGVEDGKVDPFAVIRYESTKEPPMDILKSIGFDLGEEQTV